MQSRAQLAVAEVQDTHHRATLHEAFNPTFKQVPGDQIPFLGTCTSCSLPIQKMTGAKKNNQAVVWARVQVTHHTCLKGQKSVTCLLKNVFIGCSTATIEHVQRKFGSQTSDLGTYVQDQSCHHVNHTSSNSIWQRETIDHSNNP